MLDVSVIVSNWMNHSCLPPSFLTGVRLTRVGCGLDSAHDVSSPMLETAVFIAGADISDTPQPQVVPQAL